MIHKTQAGSYTVATEGDAKLQKTTCKWAALHSVAIFALMMVNKQPWSCGGPIVAPLMAVLLGMNA
jgi:hypothetical protein